MSQEPSNPQKPINFFPVLLVSAVIVIFWLIPVFASGGWAGPMGASAGGFISIVALILTIIAPLVYGWYSRDETGAILIGVVPFLLTYGISRILSGNSPAGTGYQVYSVLYVVSLSIVGGLEGFFAAKKTAGSLLIALLLAGIWAGIFFSGIH
jgi:hypothetical protein